MKATVFLLTTVFILASITGVSAFANGDGTAANPYEISTVEHLQDMNDDLMAYYILINDIDASATVNWNGGDGFLPIGWYSPFVGNFDGQGHNITGLKIYRPTENNVGLFAELNGQTFTIGSVVKSSVTNVTMIDTLITGQNYVGVISGKSANTNTNDINVVGGTVEGVDYVGGITGQIGNNVLITDIHTDTHITGTRFVGGVAGYSMSDIDRCEVNSYAGATDEYVGGIVGYTTANVLNCVLLEYYEFQSVNSVNGRAGGIAGYANGNIDNCVSYGHIRGPNRVGGLVGWLGDSGSIINSHAYGNVDSVTASYDLGGLVGYNGGNIDDSSAWGTVESTTYAGGFVGYTHGLITRSESHGDVVTTADSGAGGFVGRNQGTITESYSTGDTEGTKIVGGFAGLNTLNAEINNCYSLGDVTRTSGSDEYFGSFVGRDSAGKITNSYTTGAVYQSPGTLWAAGDKGFAGFAEPGSEMSGNYFDVDTTGQFSSAGNAEPRTSAEMHTKSTYVGWDFTDTWEMLGSYPALIALSMGGYDVDPYIITPANGSAVYTDFPPLESAIEFQWTSHSNAVSSTYEIAKDSNFNTMQASGTITSFSRNVKLPGGDYWFRVRYNFDNGMQSAYSTSQFSIHSTPVATGTGVHGVVYQSVAGSQTPLSNIVVRVYNDTYTNDYITAANGYFIFDSELTTGIYYLQGSRDGYRDSPISIVNVQNDTITTRNIVMERETAPTFIYPHYVTFTVRSMFGGVYEDVLIKVYEGDSANPIFSETSGSDGAVGFELSQTQRYRLTLYSETDNIDTTYTVTPTKESYNIYVSLIGSSQAQQEADVILYGMHTDGNELNVTWNDTSGLTTLAEITIKNRDGTTAYYLNSTESNSYVTQEVNTTENSTYIVELSIDSDGLSNTFIRSHIITFDEGVQPAFDLGFTAEWQSMFLAALSIIFLAVLFGSANAHLGAILVSVAGLFHVFITGWIPTTVLTVAMMFIALIVSVSFYMRKAETVK